MKHFLFSIALAAVAAGCGSEATLAPNSGEVPFDETQIDKPIQGEANFGGDFRSVKALTWNVYVGTDLNKVIAAPSLPELPPLVESAWQDIAAHDFRERAEVFADKIARTRPHVVGLQEVSLLRTQSPGDIIVGGTVPATEVVYDYLDILLDALAERGHPYHVAARVENFDVELPRANATFDDVRLTDFDVILARSDVMTGNATEHSYSVRLEVPVGGGASMLQLKRGFCAVDATIEGRTLRVVNTHLETQGVPPVQEAQAAELIAMLGDQVMPVVLLGDLNTEADGSTTASYANLIDAGFVDVPGGAVHPFDDGYTCCNDKDLSNVELDLSERIDHILLRAPSNYGPEKVPAVAIVLGVRPWDRTESGLWASDHAGVISRFLVPVHD